MEVEETSPLPPTRPVDPIECIRYDTIKALWRPARRGLLGDEIIQALDEFWKIIKPVRDQWTVVEKDEADKKSEPSMVKVRLTKQRHLVASALKTALELGHGAIVES